MIKTCLNCKTDFKTYNSKRIFCSTTCGYDHKRTRKSKICPICQKKFTARNSKSKTCSTKCRGEFASRKANEKKKKICRNCKKVFIARDKSKVYCSKRCFYNDVFTRPKSKEHKQKIAEGQKKIRIEGEFVCNRCNSVFPSNTSLRAHKAHCQHEVIIKVCPKCKKKCKGNAGLKAHQIWCLDDKENLNKRKIITKAVKNGNIRRILSGNQNQSIDTDIEVIFEKNLREREIHYEHPFLFKTDKHTHLFDFYIPEFNLLIEVDGDYWHGNKGQLKSWQLRQIEIDKTYTKAATKKDFRVIRFWGSSIKKNCLDCIEETLHYGKTNQSRTNGISRDIRSWS